MDAGEKARKVVTGAAALAQAVRVHVDTEHEEVKRVDVLGVPVFLRDEDGRPRVLGVKFPRWLRGPRSG